MFIPFQRALRIYFRSTPPSFILVLIRWILRIFLHLKIQKTPYHQILPSSMIFQRIQKIQMIKMIKMTQMIRMTCCPQKNLQTFQNLQICQNLQIFKTFLIFKSYLQIRPLPQMIFSQSFLQNPLLTPQIRQMTRSLKKIRSPRRISKTLSPSCQRKMTPLFHYCSPPCRLPFCHLCSPHPDPHFSPLIPQLRLMMIHSARPTISPKSWRRISQKTRPCFRKLRKSLPWPMTMQIQRTHSPLMTRRSSKSWRTWNYCLRIQLPRRWRSWCRSICR